MQEMVREFAPPPTAWTHHSNGALSRGDRPCNLVTAVRRAASLLAMSAAVFIGMDATSPATSADWYAVPVARLTGFKTPESVLPLPERGVVFVSNIETATRGYWRKDRRGFLSLLKFTPPDTWKPAPLEWIRSAGAVPLNAPKGLCYFKGKLYAADIDRVIEIPLDAPQKGRTLRILRALQLNDMATDGRYVYVSDTAAGCVYRLNMTGYGHRRIPAPSYVNGITFYNGRMYAVGWQTHEVYILDPEGRKQPVPLGVAGAFWSLDGIELLDDETILVSDFTRGRVCWIDRNRRVHTLVEMETPADIGIDRQNLLLYVPSFERDEVRIFRLTTKKPKPKIAAEKTGKPAEKSENGDRAEAAKE